MRVWSGSVVSSTGDEITMLALPWLVLQLTHSPLQLGIVAALQNLPFLLFTLIAGVYADRWDRRRIMLSADVLRFASLATIPIAAFFGVLTIAQIYVIAFLAGTGRVWFEVAHYALLPGIVEPDQLVDANSKFQMSDGVSVFLGPSIGGFLIKLAGAANAIALDAASFLVSAAAIFTLPSLRASQSPTERGWRAQLVGGFRYLVQQRPIFENALAVLALLFFGTMVDAVFVFYAQYELHLDAALTGIVLAAAGLGPIIFGSLAPQVRRRFRTGQVMVATAILSGPLLALRDVAVLVPKPLAMALAGASLALGFGMAALWNVVTLSYRQAVIPGHLMSRVNSSLRFVGWGTMPIAAFAGGLLSQTIGVRWLIAISAVGLTLVGVGLASLSEIRRL
ncbi:MAG: MFS transporter [Candidatus Dormibacteraeota bacterium]|nr:MFS transporter [Candidatus Dormibacteraeota bacterium]